MSSSTQSPRLLWTPDASTEANAGLTHFRQWLADHKQLRFDNYDALWRWSVRDIEAFWRSQWEYFDIISHSPYSRVRSETEMPRVRWFEGATLNYAEHIFRAAQSGKPAIIFQSERHPRQEISWELLERRVAALAAHFRSLGVEPGDRIVAFLPNIPEATIGFLAACSLGAIWSSCSPDFGAQSVIDRFQQIEPSIFLTVDGYQYNGKPHDKREVVQTIAAALPSLKQSIILPYLNADCGCFLNKAVMWEEAERNEAAELRFTPVPFSHPIWVLYSSGTTGKPKAITHGHGGVLLEHLKYLAFHNDVKPGETFFWFTTTGWMMWNFVQAALLRGASIVLYDGSPGYPSLNVLWEMAGAIGLEHFGTSAPYLVACMKRDLRPAEDFDLRHLRSISSTGAPLPPEAFDYVYEHIHPQVWLASMSGGTDVCTAFVGGVPTEPVYEGEIQRRALGAAVYSFDETGEALQEEVGEMVLTKPMPSMPIFFWNDPDYARYEDSYFDTYPGIWRHGDWLLITERNTLVILGRSDATLNRHGIRIGTAEIYQALDRIPEIEDSLIVNLELKGGRHYMPLFVKMAPGQELNAAVATRVEQELRDSHSPRHVPDEIIPVPDIPFTISGKKLEAPVKKILMGIAPDKAANPGAMRNPESLDFFLAFRDKVKAL